MKMNTFIAAAMAAVLTLPSIDAYSHGGGLNSSGCHNNRKTGDYHCHRDAAGNRIGAKKGSRDPAQRRKFHRNNPCPSTGKTSGACPGYHVDHIVPLACGGADRPYNMQWLTARANLSKGSMGCSYN
jgi:5-methylcytosine-specific restriction endonuclease McrA